MPNGHAIELRLCAEDPLNDFLPAVGTLTKYNPPTQHFVRLDDFVYTNFEIPIYYDNMFAKLCVWGENRNQAIQRMIDAINEFEIEGIPNTLDFGRFVMEHPKFIDGDFDTNFIKNYFTPEALKHKENELNKAAAIFTYLAFNDDKKLRPPRNKPSAWAKR